MMSGGDDFIDFHVELGSRPRLPNDRGKVTIQCLRLKAIANFDHMHIQARIVFVQDGIGHVLQAITNDH